MKSRIIILMCATVMMVACGGGGGKSSSSCCSHGDEKKACSKEAAAGEKACCKQAATACTGDVKKIISAQVFIKPDKVDAFIAATQALLEKSRAEEGCVSYSLYQDPQDKTKFLFFEEWKNQAAVDFHFSTEHFKKFGETLNECASTPAIITIYDSTAEKKV